MNRVRGPRAAATGATIVVIVLLTWLWQKTQSVHPEDHAHVDAALRELRSVDRTINQDVLRARYQLISSYEPVLRGYRRAEELEAVIATPPRYLDAEANRRLSAAVAEYRARVTAKQALIETFKYRTANLRDLLGYLPGGGTSVSRLALADGDERLALNVNEVLQLTLLYNLTSDEKYAPLIRQKVDALVVAAEQARSYGVRRRIGTLVLNVRQLLIVKPAVDGLLRRIFDEPVVDHEDRVANLYYAGYAAADRAARRYRFVLYGSSIGLLALVGLGLRRLQQTARALAVSNERQEIAGQIQMSILPGELRAPGLEIAAGMLPSEAVGGDYYDIIPMQDGCWIAVGDVAGHGLAAGLIMLMMQSSVQALVTALPQASPSEIVATLNRVLYENIRRRTKRDEHVTFCLLRFWADGRIVFAGAHEGILICRASGAFETLTPRGAWLGARKDIRATTLDQTDRLEPGDVMLLYTDGITEAKDANGVVLGDEGLAAIFRELRDNPPAVIRDAVIAAARAQAPRVEDDQTLVVVRCESVRALDEAA